MSRHDARDGEAIRHVAPPVLQETPGVWQGEIPENSRIVDLITLLGTVEAEVAAAALNNEPCDLKAIIGDGAVVVLVTPFSGG